MSIATAQLPQNLEKASSLNRYRGNSSTESNPFKMPVSKKLKAATGRPSAAPANAKGKEKAISTTEAMDVDELQESGNEREDDDASGTSGDSDNDSGDSMDTDAEIELSQQPTKSKQTLSKLSLKL